MSLLPDPRRIVTGHSADGKAIVVDDRKVACQPSGIKCNFAVMYETHQFPEEQSTWVDPIENRTTNLANSNGIVMRIVDFPPHTKTVVSNLHPTTLLNF